MSLEPRITDAVEILTFMMADNPRLVHLSTLAVERRRRARQLRKARIARALTQADLARQTGLSQTTIGRIERMETSTPSAGTLRKLAKALKLDPKSLIPN